MAARVPLSWRITAVASSTLLLATLSAYGGTASSDGALPLEPARTIEFDTDEGTWLSLTLSPDGRRIVFDLLGDLYSVAASGGEASALSRGLPFDSQPAFSPDGSQIAFTSDRSGAENVWIADATGSNARQITANTGPNEYISPSWSADGRRIYVSLFRSDRNAIELWAYDLSGADAPQELTDGKFSALGAVASRDGAFLYYSVGTGPVFEDDVTLPLWRIDRRDLRTGATQTAVTSRGSAMRPVVSPDGRLLAYATRLGSETALRLRDLESGADRPLAYPVQHDAQEALPSRDLVPGYAFAPDGGAIFATYGGKIHRIDIASGRSEVVPFSAHVAAGIGPSLRHSIPEPGGPVQARLIQHPSESPDGRRLAFAALGHIYVMELASGRADRLTGAAVAESEPAWSPDGRRIAYVTWDSHEGGGVWSAPSDRKGAPRPIGDRGPFYSDPAYAPDGRAVFALRSSAYERLHTLKEPALWLKRSYGSLRQSDLVELREDGRARTVASGVFGGAAQFTRGDANHLYINSDNGLEAVALDGAGRRTVLSVVGPGYYFLDGPVAADDLQLSPDGRRVLAMVAGYPQLLDISGHPEPRMPIDVRTTQLPHRRITDSGADFGRWSADGAAIGWSAGARYSRRLLSDLDLDPTAAAHGDLAASGHVAAFNIHVSVPRDTPHGTLVLRGATVVPMTGEQVIHDADVVVIDNRIAAIGERGRVTVPSGATVRSVAGRFILPGLIDVHDHFGDVRREVLDFENWGFEATLAYGITSALDPSTLTLDMLAYQDLLAAGMSLGPRLYSTGPAVFSFNEFRSQQAVDAVVGKYAQDYRLNNLKEYRTGSRQVRQWVAIAGRRFGLIPTTEGALDLKLDLTQVLDGFAGNEHALAAIPLSRDVVELVARAQISYTPTLLISHGGPPAGEDFIVRSNALRDPKVAHFFPEFVREQLFSRVHWASADDRVYSRVAAGAAAIQRAGGIVSVGSHGNYPGIGYHWELQALAAGGMTPFEVLRAATRGSAEAIGRSTELGSLEPGKLADLIILERDPLADVAATLSVLEVMRNGRLYDADTLAEEWPTPRPAPHAWYQSESPLPVHAR